MLIKQNLTRVNSSLISHYLYLPAPSPKPIRLSLSPPFPASLTLSLHHSHLHPSLFFFDVPISSPSNLPLKPRGPPTRRSSWSGLLATVYGGSVGQVDVVVLPIEEKSCWCWWCPQLVRWRLPKKKKKKTTIWLKDLVGFLPSWRSLLGVPLALDLCWVCLLLWLAKHVGNYWFICWSWVELNLKLIWEIFLIFFFFSFFLFLIQCY